MRYVESEGREEVRMEWERGKCIAAARNRVDLTRL